MLWNSKLLVSPSTHSYARGFNFYLLVFLDCATAAAAADAAATATSFLLAGEGYMRSTSRYMALCLPPHLNAFPSSLRGRKEIQMLPASASLGSPTDSSPQALYTELQLLAAMLTCTSASLPAAFPASLRRKERIEMRPARGSIQLSMALYCTSSLRCTPDAASHAQLCGRMFPCSGLSFSLRQLLCQPSIHPR